MNSSYRDLVELQSPPSTYAIADLLDGRPGAGVRVADLTLQRALLIGSGLFLAGFRDRELLKGAISASMAVTAWIALDYAIQRRK